MSGLDWVRSAIIFLSAVFILNNFFISLTVFEAVILTIFTVICVVHTMDVRDEVILRVNKRRDIRDDKERKNDNGGRSGPVQGPEDDRLQE